MPIAAVGIISNEFTMPTTIIIPSKESPIWRQSIMAAGNNSSIAPISFENLFKIRPEGFVLKNLIVALVMLLNILPCSLVEALMHIVKKVKDLISDIITNPAMITE